MSARAAPAPIEVEIKFRPDVADLAVLCASLDRTASALPARAERTVYFDTPDLDLAARGIGLRIRSNGDHHEQTLKRPSGTGAAARARGEQSVTVSGERLDLEALQTQLPECDARRLAPVFVYQIHRREWRVIRPGGALSVVLDSGALTGFGAAAHDEHPLIELEIESKGAGTREIHALALELMSCAALSLSIESKAERGVRLVCGRAPEARKEKVPALARNVRVADAFGTLGNAALGHLVANQPAALEGAGVEGIHQMRVALRRLRTLLTLFDGLLDPEPAARFTQSIRQFGQILGAARDFDVLAEEVIEEALPQDEEARAALLGAIAPLREAARRAARSEISAPEFCRLVIELSLWIETGSWVAEGEAERARAGMREVAGSLLDRVAKRVRKRGARLGKADDEERHEFRKAAKRLRYGVEDFAALFDAEDVDAYAQPLKRLLDRLGVLNDTAVARQTIEALRLHGPELGPELDALGSALVRRAGRECERLDEVWSRFRSAEPFWR